MDLIIQAHDGKIAIAAKYTAVLSPEKAKELLSLLQKADGDKVRFDNADKKSAGLSARCEKETLYLEFAANFGDHDDVSTSEVAREVAIKKLTNVLSAFG
jgi:hypothetical protein